MDEALKFSAVQFESDEEEEDDPEALALKRRLSSISEVRFLYDIPALYNNNPYEMNPDNYRTRKISQDFLRILGNFCDFSWLRQFPRILGICFN